MSVPPVPSPASPVPDAGDDPTRSATSARLRRGLVALGLAASLYALLAWLFGPRDLGSALGRLLTPTGLVAAALCLASYLLRGWRWRGWMAAAGRPLAPVQGLRMYLAGYAFTPTPANAGEAARGLLLANQPLSAGQSVAIFGAERLADLCCLGLLCLPAAGWLLHRAPLLLLALALAAGAGALLLFVWRAPLVRRLPWLLDAWHCLARQPLRWLGLTLAAWSAQGLAVWLLCQQAGLPLDALQATASYALAMVGGALSTLPAGLGGTEAVLTALWLAQGASLGQAGALTLLVRLVTLWFAVVLGVLALAYSLVVRKDLRL